MTKKRKYHFFFYLRPEEIISLFFLLLLITIFFYYRVNIFHYHRLPIYLLLYAGPIIAFYYLLKYVFCSADKKLHFKLVVKKIIIFFRDWIPIILVIFIYNAIHDTTHLINSKEMDSLLIKIDKFLFFGHHPTLFFEKLINPYLSYYTFFIYDFYLWLYPLTLTIFYLRKNKKIFHQLVLTMTIALYLGLIGYLIVPCKGPVLAQRNLYSCDLFGGQDFTYTHSLAQLYIYQRYAFHCFPSLHTTLSTIFLFFILRFSSSKILRVLYLIIVPSIWFATLYLRWHYLTDIIAGFLLAYLSIYLGFKISQFWQRKSLIKANEKT